MARKHNIPTTARSAFTLLELMVSVAILLAVLALIGTIFTTASKAGGNATAVTTVYRQLREAAETIRQDLERMEPPTSVLGVAGVTVWARDSRKFPNSKSVHRADVLMLVTDRAGRRPYAFDLGIVDPDDYFSPEIMVVYGHADVASLDVNGKILAGTLKRVEELSTEGVSVIPSYDWHLGRRTVFFPITTVDHDQPVSQYEFLAGITDVAANTFDETLGWFPAGIFRFSNNNIDYAYLYLPNYTSSCSYRYDRWTDYDRRTDSWSLYESGSDARDSRWYTWDSSLEKWVRWEEWASGHPETRTPASTALTPRQLYERLAEPGMRWDLQFHHSAPSSGPNDYRRTIIDPSPLMGSLARTASYFLPNCSDFRVEFTYDDPRDVHDSHKWDESGTVGDPLSPGEPNPFTRPIRWLTIAPNTQWVWSKISAYPADPTQTDRWPTAIRITMKAWDAGGRLEEPVTYTLIHTFGSPAADRESGTLSTRE